MKLFRSFFSGIGHAIVQAVVAIIEFGIAAFKYVIENASPLARHTADRFRPIVVRVIGFLKPVYRDSYRTSGQSLNHRWLPC